MGHYKMIAFSDPVAEHADEFDEWYLEHLHEVVDVKGYTGAQLFKLHQVIMGKLNNQYMAIYDVETDDPRAVFDDLIGRQYVMGRSLDQAKVTLAFFEAHSPQVKALSS
jgi:hypothetical protein